MENNSTYLGQSVKIEKVEGDKLYILWGESQLPMWINANMLGSMNAEPPIFFNRRNPHMLIVDNFYRDPNYVRELALMQNFVPNLKHYKGKRTTERFLFPYMKEEFEKLLNAEVTGWMDQPANGCFQTTGYDDPLVWHSDCQSYAAAVYLTPSAPIGAGTSFWRDKKYFCRRPPRHELELNRFKNESLAAAAEPEIYNTYNFTHQDNWELVDKVGAVFNRLVIWDSQLIHSASSYENLGGSADNSRLVQLFFFNISKEKDGTRS